jgi:hypothetical protein
MKNLISVGLGSFDSNDFGGFELFAHAACLACCLAAWHSATKRSKAPIQV